MVQCLEDEAVRRGYEGVERPVTIAGKREIIREYSDTLLIFLLKAARPQKYRDYVRQEHVGPDGTPLNSIPSKIEIVLVPTPKAPEHLGSGEMPRALPAPAVPALEGQDPGEQRQPRRNQQQPPSTPACGIDANDVSRSRHRQMRDQQATNRNSR